MSDLPDPKDKTTSSSPKRHTELMNASKSKTSPVHKHELSHLSVSSPFKSRKPCVAFGLLLVFLLMTFKFLISKINCLLSILYPAKLMPPCQINGRLILYVRLIVIAIYLLAQKFSMFKLCMATMYPRTMTFFSVPRLLNTFI